MNGLRSVSRRVASVLVLALGVLGASLLFEGRASACSCRDMSDRELLEQSDRVFVAEVEGIKVAGRRCETVSACEAACATGAACTPSVSLRVLRAYQGAAVDRAVVETSDSGTMCGVDFEKRQRYLVFASADAKGALWTTICHGTEPSSLEEADVRMRRLHEPVLPPPRSSHCQCRAGATVRDDSVGWAAVLLALWAGLRRYGRSRQRSAPNAAGSTQAGSNAVFRLAAETIVVSGAGH